MHPLIVGMLLFGMIKTFFVSAFVVCMAQTDLSCDASRFSPEVRYMAGFVIIKSRVIK